MSDDFELHPMLDAVVRDHAKYKDARELGVRAAEETYRTYREGLDAKIANIEAARRSAPQPSRPIGRTFERD